MQRAHAIYNYYVTHTTVSFHTIELSIEEMQQTVLNGNTRYKAYALEAGGLIIGYALLTPHKNKQA
ncbi:L-amino acid N-acyltransferase YncA [Paenibacillus endophyticus]|uniref:L-amino acid N-acyltransferase YncA n=1 Tax=Paenibacillus endophyticus TaxID=1294268 RepID=A0A7W5CA72_9BACL|nr:hypothetical protein [Paenibacillus endophyticus]MBB3153992.1 L-amino acid N-acyltransferase YncA [Paenibacillus endophyticus]